MVILIIHSIPQEFLNYARGVTFDDNYILTRRYNIIAHSTSILKVVKKPVKCGKKASIPQALCGHMDNAYNN